MACIYSQCTSYYRNPKCPHLSLFSLPRKCERATQWVINCGRPDLLDFVANLNGRLNRYVCALHFERPCFMNDLRNSLTPFATPTIFLSKEETDKARSLGYASYIAAKAASNSETVAKKGEDLNGKNKLQDNIAKTTVIPKTGDLHNIKSNTNKLPSSKQICLPQETVELNGNKKTLHGSSTDQMVVQRVVVDKNARFQGLFSDTKKSANSEENNVAAAALTQIDTDTGTALISADEDNSEQMLCRLCAKFHSCLDMVHIFGNSTASTHCLHKIRRLLPISEQPFENNLLPQWVCSDCCKNLCYCDEVLRGFSSAYKKLRELFPSTKIHDVGLHEKKSAGASKMASRTTGDVDKIKDEPFPYEEIEENVIPLFNANEQQVELTPLKQEMKVSDAHGHMPSDSQDSSVSKSLLLDGIKRPIKRKSHHLGNKVKSGFSSQLMNLDSEDQGTSLSSTQVVVPSKKRRRRHASIHEYQGKKIQNSHLTIPIARDKKTIVCQWCDMNFDSVEAALTHRFREHAEKEILSAKPK